jgi:myo-inositol-1(or 4)-monophosphatase
MESRERGYRHEGPWAIAIEAVIAAVREAGRSIEEARREGFEVEAKGDASPVTVADRRADELLKARLAPVLFAAWLSEESADDRRRLDAERLWVVDPLDGTREFIAGVPEYVVAVALVEAGEPVLSAVHNPCSQDTFWAVKGQGAFLNGCRLHVREGATLLASRSELDAGEFEAFSDDWEIAPCGSIQLKLARIAAGEAAVTLSRGPKHEWDVCAGALLVTEAGGVATEVLGGGLRYNQVVPKVRGILAGAPEAHARAQELVGRAGVSHRMAELEGA